MGFSKGKNLKKIQKTVHLLSGYLNETGSQANKKRALQELPIIPNYALRKRAKMNFLFISINCLIATYC